MLMPRRSGYRSSEVGTRGAELPPFPALGSHEWHALGLP